MKPLTLGIVKRLDELFPTLARLFVFECHLLAVCTRGGVDWKDGEGVC